MATEHCYQINLIGYWYIFTKQVFETRAISGYRIECKEANIIEILMIVSYM